MLRPNVFDRFRTGISKPKILVTNFPFLDSGNNKNTCVYRIKQT